MRRKSAAPRSVVAETARVNSALLRRGERKGGVGVLGEQRERLLAYRAVCAAAGGGRRERGSGEGGGEGGREGRAMGKGGRNRGKEIYRGREK